MVNRKWVTDLVRTIGILPALISDLGKRIEIVLQVVLRQVDFGIITGADASENRKKYDGSDLVRAPGHFGTAN